MPFFLFQIHLRPRTSKLVSPSVCTTQTSLEASASCPVCRQQPTVTTSLPSIANNNGGFWVSTKNGNTIISPVLFLQRVALRLPARNNATDPQHCFVETPRAQYHESQRRQTIPTPMLSLSFCNCGRILKHWMLSQYRYHHQTPPPPPPPPMYGK